MRVAYRAATGLLIAVPTALAPLVAASAQPGPAPSPDSPASSAMAAATAPATAPAAAARDPRTPRPMRWAEYNAQKPKWSAKNCDADTRMVAKATSTKKLPVTAECARIKTPLDWSDLTKGSITLNITRVNRPAVKAKPPSSGTVAGAAPRCNSTPKPRCSNSPCPPPLRRPPGVPKRWPWP